MNECPQVREQLHDWVDRELDHEPAARVAHHLEACMGCAEIARSIQSLKLLVRAKAGNVPLPVGLETRVRESVALESTRKPRARVLRIPIPSARWVAAAAVLVIGASLSVPILFPGDLHAQVTEQALYSHMRSIGQEDTPRFQCMSREEAEDSLREQLRLAVSLPEFPIDRACVKGVSVEDFGGKKVGKVFYTLDGEEFSLFVVPGSMRGGTSLCCCHSGQRLHVYCTNEGSYCFTFVTTIDREPFRGNLLEPALHRAIQIHRAETPTGE